MMSLEPLADLLYKHSGLKLDRSRQKEIEQIISEISNQANVSSLNELCDVLNQLPTSHVLWQPLLRRVTIGETYFFRHAAQYRALQETILPSLIQKRRESNFKYLNIWSAGCATGEEIYSIAILLRELLPDIQDWTISLLGTDINHDFMDIARQGRYRAHSFRSETRGDVQGRYFTFENNFYMLDSTIRQMVQFLPLNLISDHYPSYESRTMHQDLIVCRNVTIYFDEANTRNIVSRFFSALNNGGWLMVGHAEPLASTYREFTVHNFPDCIFYQKHVQEFSFGDTKPLDKATVNMPAPAKAVITNKPVVAANKPVVADKANGLTKTVTKAAPPKASPDVTVQMVRAVVDKEDWDTAMSLLSVLESKNPMDSEVHYLRGLVLMHSGELDAARQSLRRSLYCEPSYALAHYAMGELAFQERDYESAKRAWILAERAVAGLRESVLISESDGLTTEMFRSLLSLRLKQIGEQKS